MTIAAVLVGVRSLAVSGEATSEELLSSLDLEIAAAIEKAEAGDIDGARQAIPAWAKLNIEYMRVLFQEIREISTEAVFPNCSTGGRQISIHVGDAKRVVGVWRIERLSNDPRKLADAESAAIAQVRIVGEMAANHARQCALRPGDYSGPGHPWTDFLRQVSMFPELQAEFYLSKIAKEETERLKRLPPAGNN